MSNWHISYLLGIGHRLDPVPKLDRLIRTLFSYYIGRIELAGWVPLEREFKSFVSILNSTECKIIKDGIALDVIDYLVKKARKL